MPSSRRACQQHRDHGANLGNRRNLTFIGRRWHRRPLLATTWSLCLTCRFATVVKGASLRDEIVECSQLSYERNRITFPVTMCTEYSDRRQPSLRAMEEIAWVLRSDPKKNEVGFVKRTELTRRERFELDDDEFS
jgi:hypothetical protein